MHISSAIVGLLIPPSSCKASLAVTAVSLALAGWGVSGRNRLAVELVMLLGAQAG